MCVCDHFELHFFVMKTPVRTQKCVCYENLEYILYRAMRDFPLNTIAIERYDECLKLPVGPTL